MIQKKCIPLLFLFSPALVVALTLSISCKSTTSPEPLGSLQISSNPPGAKVYIDNVDTGRTTNTTLQHVRVGNRNLKLTREGYRDYLEIVSIQANQTAQVSAELVPHSIVITSPTEGSLWRVGTAIEITWVLDAALTSFGMDAHQEIPEAPAIPDSRIIRQEVTSQRQVSRTGKKRDGQNLQNEISRTEKNQLLESQIPKTPTKTPTTPQGVRTNSSQTASFITNVKIDLYKGTSFIQTIVPVTENDGSFTWTLPAGLESGTDYNIVLTDTEVSAASGQSQDFLIVPHVYEYTQQWGGLGTGDGQLAYPYGIAADSAGYIYVADVLNDRIQKFTSSGTFVAKWGTPGNGTGQFNSPTGVAIDSLGNVYVADSENHRVQKFTSTGTFLATWGSYGSGDGQFYLPKGIAIDATGNVYVSEMNNNRVQKFTSAGVFILKWGSLGAGDGEFYQPRGIAVDSAGYVYVADSGNDRIQKFNSSGVFALSWGKEGNLDDWLAHPRGVAVDNAGYVYVADTEKNRIQKYTQMGIFVTRWGTTGSGNGEFQLPRGIAIDSAGNAYVTDTGNNRIQKFQKVGN